MLMQYTKSIFREKIPGVIRCMTQGIIDGHIFIAMGTQNKRLYILNEDCKVQSELEFSQWVRCVTAADLTHNGNSEIIAGSGDYKLHIFQNIEGNFKEIWTEDFDSFVNTCTVADITHDGNLEIIVGSWDKSIRVFTFKDNKLELLWRKDFDKAIGNLTIADTNLNNEYELIVLFKDKGLALLDASTGIQSWKFETEKELIACDVGILDMSGIPYIVVGGNNKNLLFLDTNGLKVHEIIVEDRITSLLIGDIDGGDHNEIIIGSGNKKLISYELTEPNLLSLNVKWAIRTNGVVNSILLSDINQDKVKEILFAGYDCTLSVIQDYNYGQKSLLGLPDILIKPCFTTYMEQTIEDHEKQALFCSDDESIGDKTTTSSNTMEESDTEQIFSETRSLEPNQSIEENVEEDNATSRGKMSINTKNLLPSTQEAFSTTDSEESIRSSKIGDVKSSISNPSSIESIEIIKSEINLSEDLQEPIEVEVSPNDPEIPEELQKTLTSETPSSEPLKIIKPEITLVEELHETSPNIIDHSEKNILSKAATILASIGFFATKADLILALEKGGIPNEEIDPTMEYYKMKNQLTYSRSKPRGYSFSSSDEIIEVHISQTDKKVQDSGILEKAEVIFREKQLINTKAQVIELFTSLNITKTEAEKLLEELKDKELVKYSSKKPRGYQYIGTIESVETISKSNNKLDLISKNKEDSQIIEISDDIKQQIIKIFKDTPVFSTKRELLNSIDKNIELPSPLNAEKLLDLCKLGGLVLYSRSSPRGYHFQE